MRLFAIGDVQGCYSSLLELLEKINFRRKRDHLWFCGDLVNRGPDSLAVLRFVRDLGDRATTVLGNHDLHLLAVAAGVARAKRRDTLDDILDAPDREELLDWLRHRPLAVHKHGLMLVHAGLAPDWNAKRALKLAGEVEARLRSKRHVGLLRKMYGNEPAAWDDELTGKARLRCIINYLTRVRYCSADGAIAFDANGPPGTQPAGYVPWFRVAGRASASVPVVFGHWSTLGPVDDHNALPLDTGCVWGGALTAMQLLPKVRRKSVPCPVSQAPGA